MLGAALPLARPLPLPRRLAPMPMVVMSSALRRPPELCCRADLVMSSVAAHGRCVLRLAGFRLGSPPTVPERWVVTGSQCLHGCPVFRQAGGPTRPGWGGGPAVV
eukprot:7001185-Alexandrium_andersonii.AAC.1